MGLFIRKSVEIQIMFGAVKQGYLSRFELLW